MLMKNVIRKYGTESMGYIQSDETSSDSILIVICGYFLLPYCNFALYHKVYHTKTFNIAKQVFDMLKNPRNRSCYLSL